MSNQLKLKGGYFNNNFLYPMQVPEINWVHKEKSAFYEFARETDLKESSFAVFPLSINEFNLFDEKKFTALNDIYTKKEWKNYSQSALKLFTKQGQIYAIPEDISPFVLMVNRLVLEKHNLSVPQTWEELEDQLIYFKKLNGFAPLGLIGKEIQFCMCLLFALVNS